ncbi:MAG: cytochrome B6, partial [Deltaproteobacteria bacterium]
KPVVVGLKDLPVIFARILGISEFAGKALSDLLVLVYFAVGLIIPAFIFKRFYNRLGIIRYVTTMALFLIMVGIPVKIALRLIFSIKYVVVTPWFKI